MRVEKRVQERGLVLDQVSGANDKGGTSSDGNQSQIFFSFDSSDAIVACVPTKYKDDIRQLHQILSILL